MKYNMKHKHMCTLLMIISLAASGCSLAPKEEVLPEAPVLPTSAVQEYRNVEVLRGDIIDSVSIDCTYTAFNTEEYNFSIDGIRIDHVYVEEGDFVKAGDILADLDMGNIYQQIEERTDNIELLELKLSNQEELKKMAISNQNKMKSLDGYNMQLNSEFELEIAGYDSTMNTLQDEYYIEQKRWEGLNEEVAKRKIIAGIDGFVSYISSHQDGNVSNKEAKFIKIYDPDTMVFVTNGENSDLFPPGKEINVSVSGIEYISVVTLREDLFLQEKDIAEKEKVFLKLKDMDEHLQNGDQGEIMFILNEVTDILYLPATVVHIENGKSIVYVEDDGGFKSMKEIETGITADRKVEIKSGLNEGDSVILN